MDFCKIAPGIYQYTAIDDRSRFKVLQLFPRRTATNTLKFLDKVLEQISFAIQRIQTDREKEFFAYSVQDRLMEWGIKFRPIKSRSSHRNGKIERTQRTDLDEFYSTIDIKDPDPDLPNLLSQLQFHYNWLRYHSFLKSSTPMQVITALSNKTPLWEEVDDIYDPNKKRIRDQNYWDDCQLNK